jgi:hypothetical protein
MAGTAQKAALNDKSNIFTKMADKGIKTIKNRYKYNSPKNGMKTR